MTSPEQPDKKPKKHGIADDIGQDDSDIQHMFSSVMPPQMSAIDDAIFDSAAMELADGVGDSIDAKEQTAVDNSLKRRQTAGSPRSDNFRRVFPQMLAAAAVLVFAVVLVPLMQQPDARLGTDVSRQLADSAATAEQPQINQLVDVVDADAEPLVESKVAVSSSETDSGSISSSAPESISASTSASATDSAGDLSDAGEEVSTVASSEPLAPAAPEAPKAPDVDVDTDAAGDVDAVVDNTSGVATAASSEAIELDSTADLSGSDADAIVDTDGPESADESDVPVIPLPEAEASSAPVVNNSESVESATVVKSQSAEARQKTREAILSARGARVTTIATEESTVPEMEGLVDITVSKKAAADASSASDSLGDIATQLVPQSPTTEAERLNYQFKSARNAASTESEINSSSQGASTNDESAEPVYRKSANRWKAEILKMMARDNLSQAAEEHRMFKLKFPANDFSEIDLKDIE